MRYNVWDLLGDVGGFNDGLVLLCSIFMSSYSAFAFKTEILNKMPIESEHLSGNGSSGSDASPKHAQFQNSAQYLKTLSALRAPGG